MNIKPLRDNVIVMVGKAEEKSRGGIFIPDATKEKPYEGTVIAVGPGKALDNGLIQSLLVKIGDKVLFSKYFTTVSVPDCDDMVVMSEDNILAII